ncbi:MAG: zinc-binding dehydrogenase [Chloroflexi bacterium]|nr:zinc-binding dehydrogenase [Chloroflexota bacterium]
MRGVVFLGDRKLEIQSFPDPTPEVDEVVIAVKASGMCGSDLHPYRATEGASAALGLGDVSGPVIAGHEPCGVVVARGAGVSAAEAPDGQRVMIHHYLGCGRCKHCRIGYTQMCLNGSVVYGMTGHGAHADFMKIPASTLIPLPDELSFEEGAAISCGTGTAFLALKRLDVSGRDTLAIFGQGPVGLSATMLARAMGARVIAVDLSAERRQIAQEFGAEVVIDPAAVNPVAAIRDLTHGEGADAALDCSGNPDARVAAVKATRAWGRMCFVGEGGKTTFNISQDIIRKQLTLYGSWTFSTVGQEECARFIVDRQVPLKRLLTHHFSLDQAVDAYRLFDTQTTGKGVFLF